MANNNPPFQHIKDSRQLAEFCSAAAKSSFIGFDTEFVSENRYRPELCLLQVAIDDDYAIIDTLAIDDVTPFWEVLVSGDHLTIAHAAREEFLFCYRAVQARPKRLFDIQLAAGMVGFEYPASYNNLVNRTIGVTVNKGETRTDWRRRPLSDNQIDYALQDVVHLYPVYEILSKNLEKLKRTEWYFEESDAWQENLIYTETHPQWRRLPGISSLKPPALAIVRELWIWRDGEAERRNRSPKRTLPDDLLVELSKRGTADPNNLKSIRGFENRVSGSLTKPISHAIQRGLDIPKDKRPKQLPRTKTTNLGLLGQFLSTALNVVCRQQSIASNLVGTVEDVRKMAAWKMGTMKFDKNPALASGWRSEIVGQLIEQVLEGKVAIRVDNPNSQMPLKLEFLDRK